MANSLSYIWARRILAGTQLYSSCPESFGSIQVKSEVYEILKAMVESGEITQERFNNIVGEDVN